METKKDALRGVRLGALERMLSCALSVALAAGMVPAASVAYAAEGSGESGTSQNAGGESAPGAGDRVNQDVPLDTSGSGSGSASGEGQGQGSDVSASAGQNAEGAGAPSGSGDAASSDAGGSSRYTASASGQTSADVRLDGSAKVGTIEYNGLAYTINADDPATVAVTGIAGTAPKGDVSIPSQVASGSELYKVTKIARGGGYLRLILPVR